MKINYQMYIEKNKIKSQNKKFVEVYKKIIL